MERTIHGVDEMTLLSLNVPAPYAASGISALIARSKASINI